MTKFKFFIAIILVFQFIYPLATRNEVRDKNCIEWIATYQKIFPNLEIAEVMTVIHKESRFIISCKTWEAKVKDFSWGPMQIRGKTARQIGYNGPLEELLTWETGLYWGMKYLSQCKARAVKSVTLSYGVPDPTIIRKRTFSLYNAGNLYFRWYTIDGVKEKHYANRPYVVYCEQKYWRFLKCNKWTES